MDRDTPTLDYRTPGTPGALDDPVRAAIVAHLTTTSAVWLAMSLLGLAAMLAGSVLVVAFIGACVWHIARVDAPSMSLLAGMLALQALVVVYEWRRATSEYELDRSTLLSSGPHTRASSRSEFELNATVIQFAAVVDLVTWGPRQVAMGLRRVTGRAVVPGAGRIDHASHITRLLMESGNASTLNDLLARSGHHPATMGVIAWMKRCDLIDGSSDGKRVWLSSDFVRDIERRTQRA